jgi:hypothetical protein
VFDVRLERCAKIRRAVRMQKIAPKWMVVQMKTHILHQRKIGINTISA